MKKPNYITRKFELDIQISILNNMEYYEKKKHQKKGYLENGKKDGIHQKMEGTYIIPDFKMYIKNKKKKNHLNELYNTSFNATRGDCNYYYLNKFKIVEV